MDLGELPARLRSTTKPGNAAGISASIRRAILKGRTRSADNTLVEARPRNGACRTNGHRRRPHTLSYRALLRARTVEKRRGVLDAGTRRAKSRNAFSCSRAGRCASEPWLKEGTLGLQVAHRDGKPAKSECFSVSSIEERIRTAPRRGGERRWGQGRGMESRSMIDAWGRGDTGEASNRTIPRSFSMDEANGWEPPQNGATAIVSRNGSENTRGWRTET